MFTSETITPRVKLIYAASLNGCIGHKGQIPWRIPEDLARFKTTTVGATVLMGRKTWESLPRRPLPARNHIIVSSSQELAIELGAQDGIRVVQNPYAVWDGFRPFDKRNPDLWVIGGERVFNDMLPFATEVHETLVDKIIRGDAFAAPIPHKVKYFERDPTRSDSGWKTSVSGERYCTTVWVRRKKPLNDQPNFITRGNASAPFYFADPANDR